MQQLSTTKDRYVIRLYKYMYVACFPSFLYIWKDQTTVDPPYVAYRASRLASRFSVLSLTLLKGQRANNVKLCTSHPLFKNVVARSTNCLKGIRHPLLWSEVICGMWRARGLCMSSCVLVAFWLLHVILLKLVSID